MSKPEESIRICTGCGWVKGDPIPLEALTCCPDSNYIPLRRFIDRWQREMIFDKQKILFLKNQISNLKHDKVQ